MLKGKKVLIVGGTGYVGGYIATLLQKCQAEVFTLSRKGVSNIPGVQAIKGDIMEAHKFHSLINEMDVIVHSVGTLIDASVTKRAKPGDPGTY